MQLTDAISVKQLLADHGLKATHQRLVIYRALCTGLQHPSAEQVHEMLREENPSLSLGTVYKTLDTLVQAGLLKRVHSEEGIMRYDAHVAPHNHLYCTNTNEIIDYADPELSEIISAYLSKKHFTNFEVNAVSVQISGVKPNPDLAAAVEDLPKQ